MELESRPNLAAQADSEWDRPSDASVVVVTTRVLAKKGVVWAALDDLIRAHDQTVPLDPRRAPDDAFALATRALGRRVDLFAPHLVHAFA